MGTQGRIGQMYIRFRIYPGQWKRYLRRKRASDVLNFDMHFGSLIENVTKTTRAEGLMKIRNAQMQMKKLRRFWQQSKINLRFHSNSQILFSRVFLLKHAARKGMSCDTESPIRCWGKQLKSIFLLSGKWSRYVPATWASTKFSFACKFVPTPLPLESALPRMSTHFEGWF